MRPRPATDTELWCGACKAMHPRSEFGKSKHDASGLANACKKAVAIRNRLSHARNRERNNARHATLRVGRKNGPDSVTWALKHLLADAQGRAAARGWVFDLALDTLPRPSHCPIFGVPLVYQATGRRQDNSASLDRVDSRRGYTQDNVWVICWRANQIKNDATLTELKQLCAALEAKAAGRLLDGVEHNGFPGMTDAPPAGDSALAEVGDLVAKMRAECNSALARARAAEERVAELEVEVMRLRDRIGVLRGVAT